MIKVNAIPMKEVNGIKFGMNRQEVHNVLGDATEFFKGDSQVTTDDFGYCHVYYDDDDMCEAIEFFDEVEVYINGVLAFPIDKDVFSTNFIDFIQDEDGFISYECSIGIYAPYESMESILIGKEGYYDDDE